MPDFQARSHQIEIMDDLACAGEVVNQTLRELETINRLLGGNYVTLNGIEKLVNLHKDIQNQISIADLGCGGGDILKLIAAWATKKKYIVNLLGVDANSHIVDFAKQNSIMFPRIQYEEIDIFSDEFKLKKFDIVIGTLFFHHFTSEQLSDFLKHLKNQVSMGVVINDIHRHWLAFYSIKLLTKFFSKSTMVKYDAPLSVLRAFTKKELVEILNNAGIQNYTIRWMWAFRWQVIIH